MTTADPHEVDLTVRRGSCTPEELAAVIAVVTDAYRTESEQAVADEATPDAWSLTRRGLRTQLRTELGWGRFTG